VKAILLVAQAAAVHMDDKSFSVLRGGLTALNVEPNPDGYSFSATLVAMIEGNPSAEGRDHRMQINCVNADGHKLPGFQYVEPFKLSRNGASIGAFPFSIRFPRTGVYSFQLFVDDALLADRQFSVEERP
jgi:hypothetical protein